jgi:hypothetical protein
MNTLEESIQNKLDHLDFEHLTAREQIWLTNINRLFQFISSFHGN